MNAAVRLLGLLRKEALQILRDKVVLFLILFLYTIDTLMCTKALTFDVKRLPLAIVDQDHSVASRRLTQLFTLSDAFALKRQADATAAIAGWLERGDVGVVLVIPTGFEQAYQAGKQPSLQVLLDGTNSNVAENARHYVMEITRRFQQERPALHDTPASVSAIPMPRVWYNPSQTTKAFMTLSMIAIAGMLVGVVVPAASIVREKERGTIEQLLVTPLRVGELLIAKTLPTLVINLLAIFPALLIVALFSVPLRGQLSTFLALSAIFQISAIAMGVAVATVTRTLQQALLLAFFALFPIMFLSGTMTPIESMPPFMQKLSYVSPLRYYMDVILGVFLKGSGWVELWPQALALVGVGALLFAIAATLFRRTLV